MPTHPNLKSASAAVSLSFYERFRGLYFNSERKNDKLINPTKGSNNFSAKASRIAKQACVAMSQISQLPTSKELLQRLSYSFHHSFETNPTLLHESSNYIPVISGFRFNAETSLNQLLETNIEIAWKSKSNVSVKLPSIKPRLDIVAPARTLTVNLKFISVSIAANNQRGTHFLKTLRYVSKPNDTVTIAIPYAKEKISAKEIEIPISHQRNCLNLVIASMEYITLQNGKLRVITDKKWMPVDILSAVHIK